MFSQQLLPSTQLALDFFQLFLEMGGVFAFIHSFSHGVTEFVVLTFQVVQQILDAVMGRRKEPSEQQSVLFSWRLRTG